MWWNKTRHTCLGLFTGTTHVIEMTGYVVGEDSPYLSGSVYRYNTCDRDDRVCGG